MHCGRCCPYLALTAFVVGLVWRYRSDKFGWTARSSQLHEQRLLRWGSPLFHGGILLTAAGHAVGLLVPAGRDPGGGRVGRGSTTPSRSGSAAWPG